MLLWCFWYGCIGYSIFNSGYIKFYNWKSQYLLFFKFRSYIILILIVIKAIERMHDLSIFFHS